MRIPAAFVLLIVPLAGCTEFLAPAQRSTSTRRHGDYIARIDSFAFSPDTVRHGDTVTIRLFSSANGGCFGWTVIHTHSAHRMDVTVWGRDGTPSGCGPLDTLRIRRVAAPGPWDDFLISVTQPNGPPLVRCVPVRPETRPAAPPGRTRPPVPDPCPI